jgi:hypothetical protein
LFASIDIRWEFFAPIRLRRIIAIIYRALQTRI